MLEILNLKCVLVGAVNLSGAGRLWQQVLQLVCLHPIFLCCVICRAACRTTQVFLYSRAQASLFSSLQIGISYSTRRFLKPVNRPVNAGHLEGTKARANLRCTGEI